MKTAMKRFFLLTFGFFFLVSISSLFSEAEEESMNKKIIIDERCEISINPPKEGLTPLAEETQKFTVSEANSLINLVLIGLEYYQSNPEEGLYLDWAHYDGEMFGCRKVLTVYPTSSNSRQAYA